MKMKSDVYQMWQIQFNSIEDSVVYNKLSKQWFWNMYRFMQIMDILGDTFQRCLPLHKNLLLHMTNFNTRQLFARLQQSNVLLWSEEANCVSSNADSNVTGYSNSAKKRIRNWKKIDRKCLQYPDRSLNSTCSTYATCWWNKFFNLYCNKYFSLNFCHV